MQTDEPSDRTAGVDPASAPVDNQAVADHTLAEFVRQLADAVLVADPTGTIVFWNGAAERLFGWTAAEVTGRSMDVIIPERLRARHWEGWHHVMSTAETKYGDTLLEVPALAPRRTTTLRRLHRLIAHRTRLETGHGRRRRAPRRHRPLAAAA